MAKKKHNHSDLSFKHDPFKAVKGFSVSKPDAPLPVKKTVVKQPSESMICEDAEVDFDQAMAQLGVVSLAEKDVVASRKIDFTEDDIAMGHSPPTEPENSDEALFLASLGQLDSVFKDNYDDDDPGAVAEPRRMKRLRSGKIRPQETLDLHGCYRDEAQKKVRYFLQHRYAEGLHTLLIVTGRGNRSPGGESVLRSDIEDYLRTKASAWVAEWARAPRQYGGEGALVVFLRSRK
ncbi:MAG: Smr/MutS family protein [Thermodesulfobacteriota bacterium]|nr:Smr/MutS family protein [Thermodesulfobacteriota bacterium]